MWNDHRLHWFYPLHRPLAVPTNAQKLPHRYIIRQNIFIIVINFTPTNAHSLYLHPKRNNKKVSHGGGSSYRAERICQNGTERGQRNQLRAVFCSLLATVASKLLQQSVRQTVIFKLWIGVSFYIATGFEINCNCDYMLNTLILSVELIFLKLHSFVSVFNVFLHIFRNGWKLTNGIICVLKELL